MSFGKYFIFLLNIYTVYSHYRGWQESKINCINLNQLKKIFLTDTDHDRNIQKKAKNILSTQTRSLIIGIIVGCLGNILVSWIWSNFEKIIDTATVWGTILLIIVIGISLYSLRGRFRLQYGIFEFFFGIVVAL